MKLKFILSAAVLACSLLHAPQASAGFFDAINDRIALKKVEVYKASTDKQLLDQFYVLSADGKEEGITKEIDPTIHGFTFREVSPTYLTVRRPLYKGSSLSDVAAAARAYTVSPLEDEMGQRYVALAQSRGNVVKMYKPALGATINSLYNQHWELKPAANTAQVIGVDNPMIEFSPDGKVVSIMLRSHQAVTNFTSRSYQYINIFFGPMSGQYIENKISNSAFDDNFLSEVTVANKVAKEVPAPQEADKSMTNLKALKELGELRKSGVLTEDEFAVEKKKLLLN